MEKMKLLICDDEDLKQNQLQKVLGEEFDYIKLPSVKELETYIATYDDYHSVFLDLHFDKENITLDLNKIREIKAKLNPYSKYIIYTAFTINHIDLISDLSRMGIIDEWIDIEELKLIERMPAAKLRLLNCLSYAEDIKNGLWLIHLSDLHFGKQFKVGGEDIRESLVDLVVNQIKSNIAESAACKITKPSMVITSGDLSHTADTTDFLAYKKFHIELVESLKKLNVEYPISVVAPGNHDYSWHISMIEENEIHSDDENQTIKEAKSTSEYYKSLKWKPFIDNINELHNTSKKSTDNYSWWIHDYTKRLGINIFVVNSSKNFTYKTKKEVSLTHSLIRELEKNTKLIDKQLGILVIHHPVDMWGDDKNKTELLRYLYTRLNIRVIFSGHKHRGDIIKHKIDINEFILEVQTGSVASKESGLETFQLPHYRIININRDISSNCWKNVVSYTFAYQNGAFIIQPRNAGGSYSEIELISSY